MRTRFLCLVVALGACSNDSIAINDFAKKLVDAQCANAVACEQMPDTATCEASFAVNSTGYETLVAAVNSKIVKYDGDAAASCVSEIAGQGCAFTGLQPITNDPCSKVFTGTVATGGACFISEECAGTGSVCNMTVATCDPSTTCCPGTCAAGPARMPVGGACQASSDCNDGLYCTQTTSKCASVVTASGSACDGIDGCANPLLCNYDQMTSAFTTCFTPSARNATCDPTSDLPCADERDYCDIGTKKCTPVAAVNAACDSSGTMTGITCVGYADCTNNTCVERLKAGATCQAASGPACLGGLSCPSGTCALPPAGMTCK